MSLIRALTFDLDNTLWETDISILNAEDVMVAHLRKIAPAAMMIDFNLDVFRTVRFEVVNEYPQLAHNLTRVRQETLIRWFETQGAARTLAEHLSKEGYRVFYQERQNVIPYPGTIETLAYLSKFFPLAAITNGNADLMAMPMGQYFQFSLKSEDFPRAKPDPAMFKEALSRLEIYPSECLHVGDDVQHDVEGAKSIGMQAAWLNRNNYPSNSRVKADYIITDIKELSKLLTPLC